MNFVFKGASEGIQGEIEQIRLYPYTKENGAIVAFRACRTFESKN